MKTHLLITRPRDSCAETAEIVRMAGFQPLLAPALDIRFIETSYPDPALFDAVMFSSQNAIRAMMRRASDPSWFSKKTFCVGDRTEALARQLGFHDIYNAHGTMGDLTTLIQKTLVPPARLAHFRGVDIREDPAGTLRPDRGWTIDPVILYETHPVSDLPDDVVSALGQGTVRGVLFYSPKTARSFLRGLEKAGFLAATAGMKAFCLSGAVVESLRHTTWSDILVAPTPDQTGMTAILN